MSSVSWMAEKSSTELIPMLKNAYSALKDKERDLMLAAEIGKSLLENNIQLKTSYEDLLQQTQKSYNSTTAPLPTPSSSMPVDFDSALETGSSDDEDDFYHYGDEDDDDDDDGEMRFIPSHRTREAMIEVLERKNIELSKRLESAIAEKEDSQRNNTKKSRKLEQEIENLKSNLEIASTKIQELEEMNQRQHRLERSKSLQQILRQAAKNNGELLPEEQQQEMEELLCKIDQLEIENQTVSDSKQNLENKLADTLRDLRRLKEQFEQFQFTQSDYETLQVAYERQFRHIAELNESVEEHRGVLQKLKERGVNIHSARSTPAPSVCGSVKSQTQFRNTLLGELETEWLKRNNSTTTNNSTPLSSLSSSSLSPPPPQKQETKPALNNFSSLNNVSQFTEKALATFYNAPTADSALESVLSKASGIDKELLDEALSFIGRIEDEHDNDKCLDLHEYDIQDDDDYSDDEDMDVSTMDLFGSQQQDQYPTMDLYPTLSQEDSFQVARVTQRPKTFLGRLRRLVRHFFRAVWRWCRFAMILTTAVLISVWRGPEGMMIEYHH
ncbi:hypothetical protein BDC45DRAFT_542899 [Circinella umbellata]|nr:hypothetical protein BDC45DRAFT_542899 [Circinella umbellata]